LTFLWNGSPRPATYDSFSSFGKLYPVDSGSVLLALPSWVSLLP
jgi:hypothetical protein